jgi:hypothetical protein
MATQLVWHNTPSGTPTIPFENSLDGVGFYQLSYRVFNELELTDLEIDNDGIVSPASQFTVESSNGLIVVRDNTADNKVVLISGKSASYTVDGIALDMSDLIGGTYVSSFAPRSENAAPTHVIRLPHASSINGDISPKGVRITWDGSTDGRVSIPMNESTNFWKVSDLVFDEQDFANITAEYKNADGSPIHIDYQEFMLSEVAGVTICMHLGMDESVGYPYGYGAVYIISARAGDYGDGLVVPESGTYVANMVEHIKVSAVILPNAPNKVFTWDGNVENITDDMVGRVSGMTGSESYMIRVSDTPMSFSEYSKGFHMLTNADESFPPNWTYLANIGEDFADLMGTIASGRASCDADYNPTNTFGELAALPSDGVYTIVSSDDPSIPFKLKFYEARMSKGIRIYVPPMDNPNAVVATTNTGIPYIKVDSHIYSADEVSLWKAEANTGAMVATSLDMAAEGIEPSVTDDGVFTLILVTGKAGSVHTITASGETLGIILPEDGTYVMCSGFTRITLPNAIPRMNEYGFYYHKPYHMFAIFAEMELIFTESDLCTRIFGGILGGSNVQIDWASADETTPVYDYGTITAPTTGSEPTTMRVLADGLMLGASEGDMAVIDGGQVVIRINSMSGTFDDFTGEPADDIYIPNTPTPPEPDVPTYTITFADWDGTVISQTTYEEGETITVPPDPTRESEGDTHYIFKEWTPAVQTTATADATYTAVYDSTTQNVYVIKFLDWDDRVISSTTYIEGTVIELPPNPTRADGEDYRYTFNAWTPNVPATATADGTYTATYTATPCYLIQFLDWDGSVISSQRYVQDTVIVVPDNPTRESDGVYDYEFDKWTPEVFGVAVAHATYTATYTSTLIPVYYTIVFKDWDGRVISTKEYLAGSTIIVPQNPTRDNDSTYSYVFAKWTPDVNTIASANVTYTATYTATELPVYYNIVFTDWDGTIISSQTLLKGSTVTIPPNPVRESDGSYEYTFDKWTPTVNNKATAHATYTATYTSIKIPKVYNAVSEIFATTTEWTTIRDNNKQDDGTDTVAGVNWFTYAGRVCSNLYVSGNHWIGLGNSSSEDLKINRRDGATWYVHREEGKLFRHFKFLRLRVSGYTQYNQTSNSYKITYDVILWDTGDISLHMVDIPTTNYDGVFSLGNTSYTKPTTANPDVTFYLQEDGTYQVVYEEIFLEVPYDKKYLAKVYTNDTYKVYTIVDGALSPLEATEITGELFAQFGVDEVPDGSLFLEYPHFEILKWFGHEEYVPTVSVTVEAIPYPQVVESPDYDMTDPSIYGIEKVLVEATETVSFAVSFDSGVSWKAFKSGVWVALSENDSGMSASTIKLITTEQWNAMATTGKYRFRMTLADESSIFTSLVVDYLNESDE